MSGSKDSSLFMCQEAGRAFQSRADAIFGTLPVANLPKDMPSELESRGTNETTADHKPLDRGDREHQRHRGGFFLQKSGAKRRSDEDQTDQRSERIFKRPQGRPPPAKKRSRGYRPPDHVLHPEKYTKYVCICLFSVLLAQYLGSVVCKFTGMTPTFTRDGLCCPALIVRSGLTSL